MEKSVTTARQRHALGALNRGPCSREQLDRETGASNSPEIVRQLRCQGWDIPCERVPHVDRDGIKGTHGVYQLSEHDRERLQTLRELEATELAGD